MSHPRLNVWSHNTNEEHHHAPNYTFTDTVHVPCPVALLVIHMDSGNIHRRIFFLRNCSCSLQHTIVKRKIVLSIQPVINLIVSIFYSTVFPPFGRLFTAISYFTRCVILLAIFHSLYFPLFWSILIALRCLIPFSFIPTAIDFLYLISIRVPSHVHKRKCRSVFLTL